MSEEFDTFYQSTRQRLLACVYLVTGDVAEAQDAVQEAFVRAWQRWSTVSTHESPEAWVRVVACRIATSRWRALRARARAHERYGALSATVAEPPGSQRVELVAALQQLPEPQRIAIALHYLMGLPLTEIAEETRVPVGTVKARLSRGRRALAALLSLDPMEGEKPCLTN